MLATCSRRRLVDQAQRILRRRVGAAVIHRVDGEEQVLAAQIVVQPHRAEVLADVLQGMAEGFADAAAQLGAVLRRPERQQRRHGGIHADVLFIARRVRQITLPRLRYRAQTSPSLNPQAWRKPS